MKKLPNKQNGSSCSSFPQDIPSYSYVCMWFFCFFCSLSVYWKSSDSRVRSLVMVQDDLMYFLYFILLENTKQRAKVFSVFFKQLSQFLCSHLLNVWRNHTVNHFALQTHFLPAPRIWFVLHSVFHFCSLYFHLACFTILCACWSYAFPKCIFLYEVVWLEILVRSKRFSF